MFFLRHENRRPCFFKDMRTEEHVFFKDMRTREHVSSVVDLFMDTRT